MDAKQFLELCKNRAIGNKNCEVEYEGIKYRAWQLITTYSVNGKKQRFAVLHDLKANCTIEVDLEKI